MDEQYSLKLIDLRECIKNPKYTIDMIKEKLRILNNWVQFNQLEIEPIDEALIIMVAKEIQVLYQKIWGIQNQQDLSHEYELLSTPVKEIYRFEEIEVDWQGRQDSQKRFNILKDYLESKSYFFEDIFKVYEEYEKDNVFYPDGNCYVTIDEILNQYKHKYIRQESKNIKEIEFQMIRCPEGEFWMGTDDPSFSNASHPKHRVKISKAFWIADRVVSQALWKVVMGWNPSYFAKNDIKLFPVESVTWYDCLAFCNKLSEWEGLQPCVQFSQIKMSNNHIIDAKVDWDTQANGYRLPLESEWEYAAKAHTDLMVIKNYHHPLSSTYTIKTGENPWRINDLTGNVWQWCMDIWDENAYKNHEHQPVEYALGWDQRDKKLISLRGASFAENADYLRIPTRDWLKPNSILNRRGFRIVRQDH
jgi:sulfatase modifying factor 1